MKRLNLVYAFMSTVVTAVGMAQSSPDESRAIATIDFYGQGALDAELLRKTLPIHEGDVMQMNDTASLKGRIQSALSILPHVRDVHVGGVCCSQDGGIHMFIGVEQDTNPALRFRAAPDGPARLPADLVAADAAATNAELDAVYKGQVAEDQSQGHSFLKDAPQVRALQEKLVPLAARNLGILRQVLRESVDAEQRAAAARLLGYAPNLQSVVGDLADAVTDPDPLVRNSAARALWVFTQATKPPRIPYGPFVDLLSSQDWTDLNKSSLALDNLSASRDPALLSLLHQRALSTLVSMARWHDRDHSFPAYSLLGKIGGLSDQEIQAHFDRGEAEAVVTAALKRRPDRATRH